MWATWLHMTIRWKIIHCMEPCNPCHFFITHEQAHLQASPIWHAHTHTHTHTHTQFLYDEWAHPYFISIEEYERLCAATGKLSAISGANWVRQHIENDLHLRKDTCNNKKVRERDLLTTKRGFSKRRAVRGYRRVISEVCRSLIPSFRSV